MNQCRYFAIHSIIGTTKRKFSSNHDYGKLRSLAPESIVICPKSIKVKHFFKGIVVLD